MVINTIIILIGLILGSYEDMRTREVPDILSYSMIGLGLGINVILSIIASDYRIIVSSLAGFFVAIILGLVLYYSGQWGGGDAKLFMGLGAFIGIDVFNFSSGIPILAIYFVNIFFVGAVFGIFYVIYLSFKNRKEFHEKFVNLKLNSVNKKFRIIIFSAMIIGIVLFLIFKGENIFVLIFIGITIISYLIYYSVLFIKSVEDSAMIQKIPISKLTEGDWIAKDVKLKNKKILSVSKTGISLKQINLLKKNNIKTVVIKIGMPFVPSFLIAYLLIIFIGNWTFLFI